VLEVPALSCACPWPRGRRAPASPAGRLASRRSKCGGDPRRQARLPVGGHDHRRRHLHLAARQTRPAPRRSATPALAWARCFI
jgi:hypothetical protein